MMIYAAYTILTIVSVVGAALLLINGNIGAAFLALVVGAIFINMVDTLEKK